MTDNVHSIQARQPPPTPAPGGGGNGNNLHGRLSAIEARMDYLATKEDIQRVEKLVSVREVSLQRWLVGILLSMIGILAIALVKLFG